MCVLALLGSALVTHGLSRTSAGQLAVMCGGALCGVVAPLGVLALLFITVVTVGLAVTIFGFVVNRL